MLKSCTFWSSQHLFFSINCLALLSTLAMGKIIEHLLRNWKISKLEGTYTHKQTRRKKGFCHKFFCSLYSILPFSSQKPDLSFRQLLVSPPKSHRKRDRRASQKSSFQELLEKSLGQQPEEEDAIFALAKPLKVQSQQQS